MSSDQMLILKAAVCNKIHPRNTNYLSLIQDYTDEANLCWPQPHLIWWRRAGTGDCLPVCLIKSSV